MLDSKSATMIVTLCKDDFVDAVFLPMPVQDLKNLKICDGYPAKEELDEQEPEEAFVKENSMDMTI